MRRALALVLLFAAGCGALPSGAGAPRNPPASGLGPIVPLEPAPDDGLDWTAPFLLSDPARAFSHPSVIVDGDALELWVEVASSTPGTSIARARAETFEAGVGPLEELLRPEAAWEGDALESPAVIVDEDGARLVLYVAAGQVGAARYELGSVRRAPGPIYADAAGSRVLAIAVGRREQVARIFALVDGDGGRRVNLLYAYMPSLRAAFDGGSADLKKASSAGLAMPSWAVDLVDVGVRLDVTPAGRVREDVFFTASLPSVGDLAGDAAPTAIGAASRYLGSVPLYNPALELVPTPILSGPPPPGSATAVGYRGGVLVFYSARSGPRTAIGVGRHP